MTTMISEVALFVSRWVELSILGKATIMLAMGLTAASLAGRGRASVRHLLLITTFGSLLALPLLMLATPKVTIDVPVPPAVTSNGPVSPAPMPLVPRPNDGVVSQQPHNSGWSLPSAPTILRSIWVAGAVLLLLSLSVSLWRLGRIRRRGLPWPESRVLTQTLASECGLHRPVDVLLHEDVPGPLTCGLWRPAVILPTDARTWSEAELCRALVHEFEHIRRGDWIVQLAARAICAFYWFHPLVWVAGRRLYLEAERACDDAVVQNCERADYADQLVTLARRMKTQAHPVPGMANRSDLSTRISALLDGSQRRGRVGVVAAAVAVGVATILLLAIAPVRAVSRSSLATLVAQGSQTKTTQPPSATDRALFEAAEKGRVTSMTQLLDAGANVNCVLEGDGTPLIAAARNGYLAAVQLLLERGADPNLSSPGDGSPLIMAAQGGHAEVVALLLDRGANVNQMVIGDGSPLIMAAREGHADIVVLLLDRGAGINQMVPSDENALIQASGSGHLALVRLLVSRGADINAGVWSDVMDNSKREWRSPLSMARKGGHTDVVNYLLSIGAREN